MADDRYGNGSPRFENPFDREDTKRRVYDAALHAREPLTVSEIAERADCSDESARTHLSFYARLGIVNRHGDRPVRYSRNDDYFEWRRVNALVQERAVGELQGRISELTERIEEYRSEYTADSPAEVNVLEFDEKEIDDVYLDLGDWSTAIEERQLHERARRKATASTPPSRDS